MDDYYEYNFAYELKRLVEQLAPRHPRSFRQEFSIHDVGSTEHVYTTSSHYIESQYVQTTTEIDSQSASQTTNGKPQTLHRTQPPVRSAEAEESRHDLKNLKRVHKMYQGPNIIESRGIIHPETKEVLTVGQAIGMRILDVRSGRLLSSPTTKRTLTIAEAAQEGLIDAKLAARLIGPCGTTEDGNEVTLLEAIQRELYDAEQAVPSEKRTKVISPQPADAGEGLSISDALTRGRVDLKTGLYRLPDGTYITISEAYEKGYLIYAEVIKIKSNSLSLSDAVTQGLVDETGQVIDRNSGDKFQLETAIKNELIDANVREIVDPKNDSKLTLNEAIASNLINPKTGKYIHNISKEKLTFKDAQLKKLIAKPMTLKDVCDSNLMDKTGKITSPTNKSYLSILEAISRGVLDSDTTKSITNTTSGQLLTLSEALGSQIILTDSKFRDNLTGEICTIPEAVDRGLITSVSQKSIFDIDGFRSPNTGEFIPFNVALNKGLINNLSNGSILIDPKTGRYITMDEGVKDGAVRPEVLEMLTRKIGVHDNGVELTVMEAAFRGLLDPVTGYLIEPKSRKPLPLDQAVEKKLITAEGAVLLNSLLNITLTTQTVTKTVKRYVTISNEGPSEATISFSEAIKRGLIDERSQTFTDPNSGASIPVQQALDGGLISVEKPDRVVELKITKKSFVADAPTVKTVVSSERVHTQKEVIEIPQVGWSLTHAISEKLYDPVTGLFIIPGTDRLVSFEECITLKLINPESAVVIDPKTKRRVSLGRALEKKIIDQTGHYVIDGKSVPMSEAIEKGYLLLENKAIVERQPSLRQIEITKMSSGPVKVEISSQQEKTAEVTSSGVEMILEPVQVVPGVIYDPSTALVISTTTGKSENLAAALQRGRIEENSVRIVDPKTGQTITLSEAVTKGVIDRNTGDYTDTTGRKISMADAAKFGILTVLGAPLVAAASAVKLIKNAMVTDPKTGENLPMEVAYERGLVDAETLQKYERSHITRRTSPEKDTFMKELVADVKRATEPKYTVTIGKAKSLESPIAEAKPVVLQKLRKKVITPSDAVEKGIIDHATAEILNKIDSKQMTLTEAMKSSGTIVDPQRGDTVSISEAIARGIIDPDSPTELLIPLAKSLSIPELAKQGLIDSRSGKIIHPETGLELNLREAMVCDIVDPLSLIKAPSGEIVTLQKAIENKLIDETNCEVNTHKGPINLISAVNLEIFDETPNNRTAILEIPPAAMTLPVAMQKGIIKSDSKEIIHPLTGKSIPIEKAVETDFIMSIPFSPSPDCVDMKTALETGSIDVETSTFKHPKTQESMAVSDAIERGYLIVKPAAAETMGAVTSITETVTSHHTITTKMVELITGYALVSATEIQNLTTGEIMSITEARETGIVKDEKTVKENFTTKEVKVNFDDALQRGLVDLALGTYTDPVTGKVMQISEAINEGILDTSATDRKVDLSQPLNLVEAHNVLFNVETGTFKDPEDPAKTATFSELIEKGVVNPKSVVYDVQSAESITIEDGIKKGLIDSKTGEIKDKKTGKKIDVANAAKLGLLAVVGAPVLAGVAVAKGVKSLAAKISKSQTQTSTSSITTATTSVAHAKDVSKSEKAVSNLPQRSADSNVAALAKHTIMTETTVTKIATEKPVDDKPDKIITSIAENLPITSFNENPTLKFETEDTPEKHKTVQRPDEIDSKSQVSFKETPIVQKVETIVNVTKTSTVRNEMQSHVVITESSVEKEKEMPKAQTVSSVLIEDVTSSYVEPQKHKTISEAFIEAEIGVLRPEQSRSMEELIESSPKIIIEEPTYERIPLGDAILQKKIEPKVCRIIYEGEESQLTVQDALDREQIEPNTIVDLVSKNRIAIIDEHPKYSIQITENLQPEHLAEFGAYDITNQTFLNPETGAKITFQDFLYSLQIFDPDCLLVKDLAVNEFVPMDEALARPLIDKHTGHMVDSKSGKRVQFFDCVKRGWIIETSDDVFKRNAITIDNAISSGLLNPLTGAITDPNTAETITFKDALSRDLISVDSLLVKTTTSEKPFLLSEAIDLGIVNLATGTLIDPETHKTTDLITALSDGRLVSISQKPISLEAAIRNELYSPQTGKIVNPTTKESVTIEQSVKKGIIDPSISEVKDTRANSFVNLDDALTTKLINPDTGKLCDTRDGSLVTLDIALQQGFVTTKHITYTLFEAIEQTYYSTNTGKVLNPLTGKEVTLKDAIDSRLIDVAAVQIRNDDSNALVPFTEAVENGLIDVENGVLRKPLLKLDEALDKGYLLNNQKPWSLQEGLVHGFYDPETGLLTINGVTMTLEDAITTGNINPDILTVKNSKTAEIITLSDSIKSGIINSKEGKATDPLYGDVITLNDASERGIIIPAKRKLSLPEAVFKGFYDRQTGKFINPKRTREKVPTDRALKKRFLDPQSTLVSLYGKVIPFEFAMDRGIVDAQRGAVVLSDGERIDFVEAFESGILIEVRKPMSLTEAIAKGVYDETTGLFLDPQSGKKHSLAEAIKLGIVDPDSVHVRELRSGKWNQISLIDSLDMGLVNSETAKVKDINKNNEEITLKEAFDRGLLIDSKAPITLQRAIHQGLYDPSTGKIIDPTSARKITLHEAMRRFIIGPNFLCYFDEKSEKPLSLADCCRNEIIDRRSGMFKEPGAETQISLTKALDLGLIVDIESTGFSLYECLAMELYDVENSSLINPVTDRRLTIKEALNEELINPKKSLIKNIATSKYVDLSEALSIDLIDGESCVYNLPNGNRISLTEAKIRGLIVSHRKPLSLQEAIKNGLFRSDTGKFVDPSTGEYSDLGTCIKNGFLSSETTAFKDPITNAVKPLNDAINVGDVDITKGRVLDPKSKKAYSLDIAFDKGLLVTVLEPVSENVVRKVAQDQSVAPMLREFTLDEAIKYEFIDPETAVIKDPQNGRFITVRDGLSRNIINLEQKASFDPQSGRSRSLCFNFENGTVVYVKQPLTFDNAIENRRLDVDTARFTDTTSNQVCNLRDATVLGYIDPDTALIKDNQKKRLVRLPEAFRKGLIDAEKGNILDTETSKLNTLKSALETGLLATPKNSFSVIEALDFAVYNPTTGGFSDPFITTSVIDRKRLTLSEAIESGLLEPSSTVVKEPESGRIMSLHQAIDEKLIDSVAGRLITDSDKGQSLDLLKAQAKGYILAAETRQAVEEKYRLCDETLSKLLEWVGEIEDKLANQEAAKEDLDELRNQLNTLKQIKEDIDSHQRQVTLCADQARQLLVSGSDVLAPHEVAALERGVRQLKQRCDKCSEKADKMIRRLAAARDELNKFSNELTTFNTWLDKSYRFLEDKEQSLSDLNRLGNQADVIRDFVSDVIAHQADLRFITMSAQKFVDESKEYLDTLNEYRASLPSRLSHIAPSGSAVRDAASNARRRHNDLLTRAQRLHDQLRATAATTGHYDDAVDRANRWLKEIEPQVRALISEPVGTEPRQVESQLTKARTLHSDILSQGRLIDNAKDACDQLAKSLEGNLTPAEIRKLEVPVIELARRYTEISDATAERCALLDAALLQSQGLQDSLENQAAWLNQAENAFKSLHEPASLIRSRLDEQIRAHRIARADLDSHSAALHQLAASAEELTRTASNARLAKKIEQRMHELYSRYEKLVDKSVKRGEFLDEVSNELNQFSSQASQLEQLHQQILDQVESRDLARLQPEEFRAKMSQLSQARDAKRPLLEECIRNGKQLIAKKDVTDTQGVRDRIKALENQWKDLNTSMDEKLKLSKQRADQLNQYESLRNQVLEWLQAMEVTMNRLHPVAVDLEVIKRQQDELKPLLKEYRDYIHTIDKLNEAGAVYDALTRGDRADSPHRKRSPQSNTAFSPTGRRQTPLRGADGRSPSPTKTLVSPVSVQSGSSGFSSRRSSQDGFHLEDLTPVQQQLTDVNNRYHLIGVKLSDRQNELDSVREEVKRHIESLKNLLSFLDKIQRQLPKDSVPNTKEEADKTMKQVRALLEEMYEKQSILDSTKSQVRELLRRKSGVQGADRLNEEMEDVAQRWKGLYDACKDKIRLMEDIKDFHDTHDGLNHWLTAKDRMMNALGPISSDSRMVQTQVQQVQVLREEFRSQQPQLSHLQSVGGSVLGSLDARSPDAGRVKQKLDSILQRWEDLLQRLEQRGAALGAAAGTAREFDAGIARLKAQLEAIADALRDISPMADPHDQLKEVQNLERHLEGQRPLLADLEAAGEELSEVLADASARQDIQARLAGVVRQHNNLQKKIDNRKAELEGALRDGRQLEESVAKTLGWLQSELGTLPTRFQVSANKETLQHQVEQHEPIYRDVMAKEHEIIMLLNKGREMENKPAHPNLRKDLDRIQQQWDRLRRETVDRNTRLQTAMEHCRKYGKAQEQFLPWVSATETKLANLPAAQFTKKDMEKHLRDLQQVRNDVWKRSGEYENNRTLGETFISACDVDQDIVKTQLAEMKERWDRINNEVLQQLEWWSEAARRLSEWGEKVRGVEVPLARCEERLATALKAPPVADAKLADAVARISDEAAALIAPLQSINQAADDIITLALESAGPDVASQAKRVLYDQAGDLGDRLQDLQDKAGDARARLMGAATALSGFNDQVKALSHDLTDLERDLDSMKPPGREVKTVKQQIEDLGKFYKKLEKADDLVADAERAGETLVESGFAPDSVHTREQVDGLRRHLAKLDERARGKEQDLNDTLDKLQAFYQAYDSVMDDIQDASEQVQKLKPVSSEVDQIRSQQKDFAGLKKSTLEPLGANVVQCNKIGQGLVRGAQQGVSTAQLEKDLEKMNDRWNALKEKMNERERRLDVGLLQSGKFQEALAGLDKWLSDTEELVANQKPPSSDYKVVKAQMQEQKFLKKMLLDRQNSMSSLFQMGNDVAAGCEPAERKVIEKQLKGLMGRFDALTNGAQQRMLDLEQAMKVAKQFQEELQPLLEWLGNTERKIKILELVPTDEEKIQQKIREHKAIHEDILSKRPTFSKLTDTASQLMALVGEDEAANLADKLQAATDRYQALVDHSLNVGELLDRSRQGLRHLVLTYQDLTAWMDEMEQRLARRKVLPVHTEKLLRQMDELADLTEEIASKQEAVDSTVESGLELMKHISSDEALQLKDKLDALQRRYNDLTSKGAELLRLASEALPLVQQFYNSHNKLTDWMSSAEVALQAAEPREADILRLEADLHDLRPVLDNINSIGPQLCQISPGEGASHIESLVTRDNRRFDAIVEQIQRKAERLLLSKKRSLEVAGDMSDLLEWFRAVDAQLRDADAPRCEVALVRMQLTQHRAINDDVAAQRARARDLIAAAKKVLRESQPSEDTSIIRDTMEDLKETVDTVCQLSADRLAALEQALPLAEHFADTHQGLAHWLDDMEHQISMLAMPALRPEQIVVQQDKNQLLLQSISEHKPLVDKLVKTGEALAKLCGEEDATKIQDIVESDCDRYNALKIEMRQRQQALEQALQESSQFSDKLEGMLRALAGTADQVNNAEPISAHPPKIQDQIEENDGIVDELDARTDAYNAVQKAAADVISKATNRADPAVRDIKKKLDKLNALWNDVQKATGDRSKSLDETLAIAKKFWKQLNEVMATLGELEDTLSAQPPPAAQPRAIQAQQVTLQEIRHEIDQTKPEVEEVRKTGSKLMNLCGEPDKPEVKKHIEDLDHAWDNITALYAKREENLIDAMEKAMEFHETLQNLLEFLETAEVKFSKMGPLGSDIDAVKRQIGQLNDFKQEVDPHMVKVEALNRQAQELTARTSSEQQAAIRQPLTEVNSRWGALLRGMVDRQRQLEHALLRLGQFQHALDELLVWIQRTDRTLDELRPVAGDPQVLEVELAKLKVLVNDIQAHQSSVDTLNDAGMQIIQQGKGTDEASATQDKLLILNRKWKELQQKAQDRHTELEDALREAQRFNAEIQDLLSWLGDVDSTIAASRPVGGLPETASEQLERFMEIYNEIEENRPKVEAVLQQGAEYLKRQEKPTPGSTLQHNLKMLKQRWDSVTARASDKKIKLEIALKEATEFHDALQAFVNWLTNAEKVLSSAKPVSRIMETILTQIEEHKSFQREVATHRETMLQLDKKGTHLKYFSQKQDVILIKNLLVSVQHRWERVVAKAAERTRALDHGFKEARDFHEQWSGMMSWLSDTEKQLDVLSAEATVNDPEKIKQRLLKHKEFQKALAAKQPVYDTTMKTGKQLKDKAPKGDESTLKQMLADLKSKWTTVCSKAVDRQRKLEEALLYSGQFKDAMGALLDWLKRQRADLSENTPVHGDLDTVMALIEQHKRFEEDLTSRQSQMQSVMKTGRELASTAPVNDANAIKRQCDDLRIIWDEVHDLTEKRARRLESALKEAEKLHKWVHMLLEWLSDAETKLRFSGQLPVGDQETAQQLLDHEKFMRELKDKERDKNDTIALAQAILAKAHPDAVTVIKHWITIIQSRWDEVSQWAIQRGNKLESHMQSLKDLDQVLEELLQWLAGLENTLLSLEAEPLPESIPLLEGLIQDHKELMENTQKRQPEVDRVCKANQVRPQSQGREPPKRLTTKTPTRGTPGKGSQHDLHRERSVSPEHYGFGRRTSRISPGRESSPDLHLPHYGPRFPAKGSKGSEPEFRSPRVRQLWDRWRNVWLLAWERQRRLHERLAHLKEVERVSNFSWDDWRKRFLKFMNHKKSRLTDLFRKMDKDNNGLIPRDDFIDGIINTKFDTSRLEMGAVADLFDRNGSGLIDWQEFVAALRPDWIDRRPENDADKIHDEVKRLVMLCTCRQKFRVFQVGEGKYRFGDSQKLRLVRILRSTVMVRVGGGWVALDEFLVKNDPCRAKGRTNIELREQFILADGVSQSMAAFRPRTARSQTATPPAAGPITKVRERSVRSVPMGGVQSRASRSSLSAGTPDSLSDNDASRSATPARKTSTGRSAVTPGGSRPSSRPASRGGSKPPSRHGSNLSLDSTDDGTPSRIPLRRVTTTRSGNTTPRTTTTGTTKLGVGFVTNGSGSRPRTPTGILSPAAGKYTGNGIFRTSSIPTLSSPGSMISSVHSQPASSSSEREPAPRSKISSGPHSSSHPHPHPVHPSGNSKIPVFVGAPSRGAVRSRSADRRRTPERSPEEDSSLFNISAMSSDNDNDNDNEASLGSNESCGGAQRSGPGSGSFIGTGGTPSGRSRIPVPSTAASTHTTTTNHRSSSGTTTPSGGLNRKPSNASETGGRRTPQPPTDRREPFRL